jgi:hypothetical protein
MSLLTAIQDAMLLCGLTKPLAVITSTDNAVQQFVAFAQQEVDETFTGNNWRNSRIDMQITGDGTSTLWPLPTDFERMLPGQALWSHKYPSIPLQGPIGEADYLALKALPVMPVRPVWRLIGGILEIWPALSSGEIVNGVYFSTNPIASADGLTRYLRWTNDTDFAMFPETILRSGIIWRWKKSKGLDYAEDFRTWQMELEKKAGHEAGAKIVRMTNTYNMGAHQWPGVVSVISP